MYSDGLGMLPEASRARELHTMGRDALAPEVCSEGIAVVRQTIWTQIVLKFSLLYANIRSNSMFF